MKGHDCIYSGTSYVLDCAGPRAARAACEQVALDLRSPAQSQGKH